MAVPHGSSSVAFSCCHSLFPPFPTHIQSFSVHLTLSNTLSERSITRPDPLQQIRLRQVTHHQSSLTACGGRVSLTPRLSSYSFNLPAQPSAPMVSEHLSLPCTPGPRGAVKAVHAQTCVSQSRPKAVLLPHIAFVVPIPKPPCVLFYLLSRHGSHARHVLNQRGATHPCRLRNRQATRSRPLPVWEYRAATDFNRGHSDKSLL